jgi:ethanolamine-phosphate cytidylyltransferase
MDSADSRLANGAALLLGAAGVALYYQLNPPTSRREGRIVKRTAEEELAEAEKRVAELRMQLSTSFVSSVPAPLKPKEVRIWMDGAFDMMHYGHVNAVRQGRARGTHLVVGVNDDASITRCKGPPVMNDAERLAMVQACRFVDEVVPKVPYVMDDEYIRWMLKTYRIDYVVHGDDPCIVDGKLVYQSAIDMGKYKTIPRTEGVSTTEITGRMLLLTKEHHAGCAAGAVASAASVPSGSSPGTKLSLLAGSASPPPSPRATLAVPPSPSAAAFVRESKFMTTSRMLRLFSEGAAKAPPPGARVVYVDGGWDMFHAGHVSFLEAARKLGDFLLVGVHNDVVVNKRRGANFPILNTNERVLSVLACKHVGDVVIDPPWVMTKEMIAALKISVVAHGSTNDPNDDVEDPYAVPKQMGIFHSIPSTVDLTVHAIVTRIQSNHERMRAKVERMMQAEKEYYADRYGFAAEDTN